VALEGEVKTRAVLVMGVSGSGKTTVGQALAERLGWTFADADDYHPESNRQKMASGQPLTDADREPWLLRLRGLIEAHLTAEQPLILACSALKERYREILTKGLTGVGVVFLHGSRELIAQRMQQREHFMPVALLDSQLSTLEPPAEAITVDISEPLENIVERIVGQLEP
jgi:carbohydrate kinase (thermoresistant glucokinase family)